MLFAGGQNEPAGKYSSLDLLKNEIDDLRRQMEIRSERAKK